MCEWWGVWRPGEGWREESVSVLRRMLMCEVWDTHVECIGVGVHVWVVREIHERKSNHRSPDSHEIMIWNAKIKH